jgi:7,8-dihydropterin-6-yl-methyl-4-(beta-D-ribofuranosyl)aminobenzene 5'-phosphate synthase
MTISILTDNHPGVRTPAEHGLSYLIEFDGKSLLFDTGQSDMFLRNAGKMNIDIQGTDMIILSHGHFDHGNGLEYLSGGKLICHPDCFASRYRKKDHSYIGLKNSRNEIAVKFNLITVKEPFSISEKNIFLGEISRLTSFESQSTAFVFNDGTPDFVMDDSAIAMQTGKGLFIVTGCGHAGIVNTMEYAKKVTGESIIYGIMGGFHLKEIDNQTKESIKYLKANKVKHVYPSHCTALPALSAFYESFNIEQVKTGDIFKF